MCADPRNKYNPTRLLLNSPFITGRAGWFRKGMMDLKFEGENILRKTGKSTDSGIHYEIESS